MASATVAGLLLESILAQPPPATTAELWVDASNWTGNLTDQGCADLKAAGYVGVIIQAITGLDGVSYTQQQVDAALRNGLRVGGYLWCFPGVTPRSIQQRLAMYPHRPESLWLDVEQSGLTVADIERDLLELDAWWGK